MKTLNLPQFLEALKKWEEAYSGDDHGKMIIGSRNKKPQFTEEKKKDDARN